MEVIEYKELRERVKELEVEGRSVRTVDLRGIHGSGKDDYMYSQFFLESFVEGVVYDKAEASPGVSCELRLKMGSPSSFVWVTYAAEEAEGGSGMVFGDSTLFVRIDGSYLFPPFG